MKTNRNNSLLAAAALSLTLAAPSAHAGTTLYWDGAGTWTDANEWSLVSGAPFDQTWTAGDDAVFNVVNSTIAGAATSFNSITANENVTVSGTALLTGTGTGNVTVAAGKLLSWGTSNLAGNIVKLGDGEMTIGQTNSGITGFTIGAGTVTVATFNALGTGAGFLTINGGTLASGGGRDFSGKFSQINFGGNFAITNTLSVVSGFTFNAPTSLGSVVSTITTNSNVTLNGIVSGSGGGITKEGAASLTLGAAGNHTYTGPTTVNAGGFSISGNLTGGGNISTGGTGNLSVAGAISGASSIAQGSTGTMTLQGNNSYSGTTTATAGVLLATKAAALTGYDAPGADKVTFNGGTIAARMGDGAATGWSTDQVNTLLAQSTKTSGALGIEITSGNLNQWAEFTTDNFETLGLTKLGAGTLTLTEANNYTGATTVIAGTLSVTGSLSGGGAVAVAGGTFSLAGSLTGDSAVSTSGTGIFNQSGTGALNGATSFTQGSTGTSVLSLANTYTGNTTATAGTISLTGNLSGGGAVSTSGTGIITQGAASIISGASSFTQGSTGTSTLAGANSYSGDTSVTAGTLSLTGSLTGGGAVSTSGTGILTQAAASVISGASSIAQGSTGFSTLAGNNSYSGNTTVTGGTLFTTKAAALSGYDTAGKVTVNGGTIIARLGDGADTGWATAQVDTLLAGATKTSGVLGIDTTNGSITQWTGFNTSNFGALGLTKLGANTLTLNQANSYTGPTTIAAGAVTINSIGTLGGSSSLGAPTDAINGTISMGSAGNAAQITYLGTAQTTDRVINMAGTTGGVILDQSGTGLLKFTSALTATGTGAKTLTLQGSTTGSGEIAGAIVDNGVVAITKTGTGTWTLSGSNTNTGNTTLSGGGALVLDYGTNDNNKIAGVVSFGGGTLNIKGATGSHVEDVTSAFILAGGTFVTRSGANTVKLNINNITGRSVGGTISFSDGTLANTDRANVNGILGGWATVGSNWAVNSTGGDNGNITALTSYTNMNGVTSVGSATANYQLTGSQTNAATAVNSLRISNTANNQTLTLTGALTITTATTASFGGILYAGENDNNYTITGGNITTLSTTRDIIIHAHAGTLTVNSSLGPASSNLATVTKSGAGTLVLGANNNFTRGIWVNEGTLRLTNNNGAGTTAAGIVVQNNAALELANGMVIGGEALTITGSGIANAGALRSLATTTASYAGAITIGSGGARINSDAGLFTLTGGVATAALSNVTFGGAGNTTVSTGVIGGAGGLVKDGAGVVTLSGTNTYTGATTVAAGVLAVNGSLANTTTTVQNTGKLQGSGAIGGGVTIQNGGTLAPGNSIESLAAGSLTMQSGSTFAYEVLNKTSIGADLLAVSSTISLSLVTLSLDASTLAALGDGFWTFGNKLTLISYFDARLGITSGFTGYADDTSYLFGPNEWQFDYNDTLAGGNFGADAIASSQNKFVTMTVIPEPGTALLGGLGLLALLRRRR